MRSYLYITNVGNLPETDADALLLDTRNADAALVRATADRPDGPAVWARLGAEERQERAVRAVIAPGLAGVFVAARSANELAALASVLAEAEEALGLPVGHVAVVVRLETAAAVLQAAEIALGPRVVRLQLADARIAAQLDVAPGDEQLLAARSAVVLASAAAGLAAPLATSCPPGMDAARSAATLRRLGFGGRTCLDEPEVRVANEVFANTCIDKK